MAAIITFIPSLVLPSLFQIVLSGSQLVISPIIEVITSVIYMALTTLGCGGCGLGGGTIGALGGGGICTVIMSWVTLAGTALGGVFGFGGYGIIDMILAAFAGVVGIANIILGMISGALHCTW